MASTAAQNLIDAIGDRRALIGIVGLGYVGLPLALAALRRGFRVLGFDIDEARVDQINAGRETIKHIPMEPIVAGAGAGPVRGDHRFRPPRRARRDADLRADAAHAPSRARPVLRRARPPRRSPRRLRPGQLVVLESTTYPGTTDELMRPILEQARA